MSAFEWNRTEIGSDSIQTRPTRRKNKIVAKESLQKRRKMEIIQCSTAQICDKIPYGIPSEITEKFGQGKGAGEKKCARKQHQNKT